MVANRVRSLTGVGVLTRSSSHDRRTWPRSSLPPRPGALWLPFVAETLGDWIYLTFVLRAKTLWTLVPTKLRPEASMLRVVDSATTARTAAGAT